MIKIRWANIKRDLCLNGVTECYFLRSNWEKFEPNDPPSKVSIQYLIFRLVYMLLFFGSLFIGICSNVYNGYFFLFLTNQTFVIQVAYSIVYFFYVAWMFWKGTERPSQPELTSLYPPSENPPTTSEYDSIQIERPPVICKILWVFMTILQVAPYFVSVGFWLVVAHEVTITGPCENVNNVIVHAFNSIGALVDSLVIAVPSRPIHCIFVFIYASYYGLFTGLYELWNGKYPKPDPNKQFIYGILDWRKKPGGAAVAVVGGLIGYVVGFFIFSFGIYHLRLHLSRKFLREDKGQAQQSESNDNLVEVKSANSAVDMTVAPTQVPPEGFRSMITAKDL